MIRDILERLRAALENPAEEFQPDGTPKMANLLRDAAEEIANLRHPIRMAPQVGEVWMETATRQMFDIVALSVGRGLPLQGKSLVTFKQCNTGVRMTALVEDFVINGFVRMSPTAASPAARGSKPWDKVIMP